MQNMLTRLCKIHHLDGSIGSLNLRSTARSTMISLSLPRQSQGKANIDQDTNNSRTSQRRLYFTSVLLTLSSLQFNNSLYLYLLLHFVMNIMTTNDNSPSEALPTWPRVNDP